MAKIRCTSFIALQMIQNGLAAAKDDYKEIGRPLTLRMHNQAHRSLLENALDTKVGSETVNMSGITNLLGLLLVVTNVKNVLSELKKNGFALSQVIENIIE